MRDYKRKKILGFVLLITAALWLSAGAVFSLTLDLAAEEGTVTMPDATVVTMWGLRDTVNNPDVGAWSIPVFKTTDTILTINLTNNLPDDSASTLAKPTSLIIPGLQATEPGAMVPTWTDGTTGSRGGDVTKRVRSLTREATNGAGTESYSWALKPGTYLIQSGTHQAVQVQMGLFAVLVVYPAATPNQAYDVSATSAIPADQLTFTTEQVLVYSEVDTALHAAIAIDQYGTGKTYTSTMDYDPNYYLVNGQPFSASAPVVSAGSTADNILLRFVNAGYETRVPTLQGDYFRLIAEDGNLLPYSQELYSLELAAGKVKDVIWSSPQPGVTNIYDARFNLTNDGVSGGGLLTKLSISAEGSLLVPNGGEVWTRGSTYTVSWVIDAAANNYNLFYFDADGTPHFIVNVGNVDTYDWTVPLDVLTESGKKFRITAFSDTTRLGLDWSDQTFTIAPNLFPNGGESFTEGMTYQLTWASIPGADNYNLFYFDTDNTAHFIANAVGNAGTYSWAVPLSGPAGVDKRFRVTPFAGTTVISSGIQWSEGTFDIVSQLSPNGGENLIIGNSYDLTWAPVTGADKYNLFYFDADMTARFIATVDAETLYNWTVPAGAIPESGKKFRVTPFTGTTRLDSDIQWSDGNFTIAVP